MANEFEKAVNSKKVEKKDDVKPMEKKVDSKAEELLDVLNRLTVLEDTLVAMLSCFDTKWHIAKLRKVIEDYEQNIQN